MGWLRKEARKGLSIGGLCTATQVLATAGLLDGKKCTIHWENRDSFLEDFPEHLLNASVYTVDGNRYTAAGGVASADLMLHLIGKEFGADLANSVADQMIHTAIRTEKDDQRLSIPTRIGVRHPKLAAVLDLMQKSLEEPESHLNLLLKLESLHVNLSVYFEDTSTGHQNGITWSFAYRKHEISYYKQI